MVGRHELYVVQMCTFLDATALQASRKVIFLGRNGRCGLFRSAASSNVAGRFVALLLDPQTPNGNVLYLKAHHSFQQNDCGFVDHCWDLKTSSWAQLDPTQVSLRSL